MNILVIRAGEHDNPKLVNLLKEKHCVVDVFSSFDLLIDKVDSNEIISVCFNGRKNDIFDYIFFLGTPVVMASEEDKFFMESELYSAIITILLVKHTKLYNKGLVLRFNQYSNSKIGLSMELSTLGWNLPELLIEKTDKEEVFRKYAPQITEKSNVKYVVYLTTRKYIFWPGINIYLNDKFELLLKKTQLYMGKNEIDFIKISIMVTIDDNVFLYGVSTELPWELPDKLNRYLIDEILQKW